MEGLTKAHAQLDGAKRIYDPKCDDCHVAEKVGPQRSQEQRRREGRNARESCEDGDHASSLSR